jgi:hypothetical protein
MHPLTVGWTVYSSDKRFHPTRSKNNAVSERKKLPTVCDGVPFCTDHIFPRLIPVSLFWDLSNETIMILYNIEKKPQRFNMLDGLTYVWYLYIISYMVTVALIY